MKKKKSSAWKDAEKKVAKILNGTRNQRVVMNVFDSMPDIDHFMLIPEIKHGYTFPSYLTDWFKEVEKYENPDMKIRCVIWGGKNKRTKDKIVMIKLEEFQGLLETIKDFNDNAFRYKAVGLMEKLKKEIKLSLKKLEMFKDDMAKRK